MQNFPNIRPSFPIKEPLSLPKTRTPFENGSVQSRVQFTRARKRFALKFTKLYRAEAEELEEFFQTVGSGQFCWTHPLTGKSYICIISDDEFDLTGTEGELCDVNLNIEEV